MVLFTYVGAILVGWLLVMCHLLCFVRETDELRNTLSHVHKVLAEKQKVAGAQMCTEVRSLDEIRSPQLQVEWHGH